MLRKKTRCFVDLNRTSEAFLNIIWKKNVLIISRKIREIVAVCKNKKYFKMIDGFFN